MLSWQNFITLRNFKSDNLVSDDGSYHLSFDGHQSIKFYYYHGKNYNFTQIYPIDKVENLTKNNLTFKLNVDAKDAFSDCIDYNLGQNQFLKKAKAYSDFISCQLKNIDTLDGNCNIQKWNSRNRELTFLIQISNSSNTSAQVAMKNQYGSVQCRMATSAAGNDEHSFLFHFGPLVSTPKQLMIRSISAVTQQPDLPPISPVGHSTFTMGQTSAVSVLIGISIISILAAFSCGCYHRRRMKTVIDMWTPDEVK